MNRYNLHLPKNLPEFYPGKRFVKHTTQESSRVTLHSRHEHREGIWYLQPDGSDRPYILDSEEHLRLYYEPL